MMKKWLSWINLGIGSLCVLFLLGAALVSFILPNEIIITDPTLTKRTLPACSFELSKEACDSIGKTLELKFSPMSIQLPDLRNQLIYYGKNGRPDAEQDRSILHFAFAGTPTLASIPAGERLYLVYEKKPTGSASYSFSPNNVETSMWLEASPNGSEATMNLFLKNENGVIIREPASHAQFSLPEKEHIRNAGKVWEIGKWRVDGSLLARQKARWMGSDVFLERHGGEEYKSEIGKNRIDFSDEDESYSVYVGLNDSLAWINNKWKAVQPGPESREHALLIVRKIDERLINLELWDIGGKNKIFLNLIKTNEPWTPQNIQGNFKFMGARTRSQYIFEIDGKRMFLSPHDWLLQTKDGWIKLNTVEQIDDYVARKLTGVLFVFDGVDVQESRQVLLGTMYNASRTEMKEIQIPVQQKGNKPNSQDAASKVDNLNKDSDDDDDDDDDEDLDDMPINAPKPRGNGMQPQPSH